MELEDVIVATFDSQTEALRTADMLKAEGIPSAHVPLDSADGGLAEASGPFEVRVRSEDAAMAHRILEDLGAN